MSPFIFLSGTIGEERAIEALRRGAVDYVLKSNPMRLVPAVKRALAEAELRRASRIAERRTQRVTGVLQMLSAINAAVVRTSERNEFLNEACRLAHLLGGYAGAMIAVIDPATRMARSVAAGGCLSRAWPGRTSGWPIPRLRTPVSQVASCVPVRRSFATIS